MAETGYEINYSDPKFKKVESDKQAALNENEKAYDSMISSSDRFYQAQSDAAKDYADKQSELQNQQTDFAIDQINQQKEQAQKDYLKEQSGAYTDWQKQSDPTGARAEQLADKGMQQTGYAESSQVKLYTAYQQRVSAARESYDKAVLNYNNAITQARLQNSATLAEIAYNALKTQLELSLNGFQYKNQLLLEKLNRKFQLDESYHSRYQDVLSQLNTENALAEQQRQAKASLAEQQRQFNYYNRLGEFSKKKTGGSRSGGAGRSLTGIPALDYGAARSSYRSGRSGDSMDGASRTTLDSVLSSGLGPASASTVAGAVGSGKVSSRTDPDGSTVISKAEEFKPTTHLR